MSFIYYMLAGVLGGLLGGMGMGGGTLLIPLLTLFFGVEQHVAQAANLIAFLPMAAFSLPMHQKKGLLKKRGLLPVVLPAVCFSVLGSIVASYLPGNILRRLFGVFLIFLAIKQAISSR